MAKNLAQQRREEIIRAAQVLYHSRVSRNGYGRYCSGIWDERRSYL